MYRIKFLTALAMLTSISVFAQDHRSPQSAPVRAGGQNTSLSPTGSSSADLRSTNVSTTGTLHGTGTSGHWNNASTTGVLHGQRGPTGALTGTGTAGQWNNSGTTGTRTLKKAGETTSPQDIKG